MRTFGASVFAWRVWGTHHLPAQGPAIVACNHLTYWDPPFIGAALRRPVQFLAKAELFGLPLLGPLLDACGAIPIRRGRIDREALQRALDALACGRVVGVFPEGTCNGLRKLLPPYEGVGWLAVRTRAPVVPAALTGFATARLVPGWSFPVRPALAFGPALHFPACDYPVGDRLIRCLVTHTIMDAIRRLHSGLMGRKSDEAPQHDQRPSASPPAGEVEDFPTHLERPQPVFTRHSRT